MISDLRPPILAFGASSSISAQIVLDHRRDSVFSLCPPMQ
jgi:hypothetical protein